MVSFERTHAPEEGVVFIAMPFGVKDGYDFDRFHDGILVPTLKQLDLKPERLDDIYATTDMPQLIIRSVQRAELVIVDLSAKSVNVGWELCLASVYGKRLVYIATKGSRIPSDLPNDRVLWYPSDNDVFEMHAFQDQFQQQVVALLREPAEEMALVPFIGMTRVRATVCHVNAEYATVKTADGDFGFLTGADVDYTRVYSDLSKRLKVGDQLSGGFVVDTATQRPKYTLLNAEDNPWPRIASSYQIGTEFTGTVITVSQTVGVFVRLLGRVNGLVPKKFFPHGLPEVGTELDVMVSRLDIAARRVGLDLQHPMSSQSRARKTITTNPHLPSVGTRFEGVVERAVALTPEGRGAYALIELPGYKRRGLLLAKNMTEDLRKDFDHGELEPEEYVQVEVIQVDPARNRILLRDLEDAVAETS